MPEDRPFARAPVAGAAFGGVLVLGCIALSANNILAFFSLGGLIVVIGGVIAVAFMSFPADDVHAALAAIAAMLREPRSTHHDLYRDMRNIMTWAHVIKEKGRRRLESGLSTSGLDDPFLQYGLNMVLGEYTPDEVRGMMTSAAEAQYERESVPLDVLQAMASHAPAFGMVGTLVGMIAMLRSLDGNVAGIGSTLAVAFLSTLYGVISARMVYMPAAARLRQAVESSSFRNTLVTEGMVMLAGNSTPSHIQDRLNGFLPYAMRDYFDSLATGQGEARLRPAMPRLRAVGP
jgi:chemotaxis protein MotA